MSHANLNATCSTFVAASINQEHQFSHVVAIIMKTYLNLQYSLTLTAITLLIRDVLNW